MNVTSYTSGPESTGKRPGDPLYGITRSGAKAGPGTLAAPPAYMGQRMYVPGYGWGTVQDIGGAIKGNHLDVWFEKVEDARKWGAKTLMWSFAKSRRAARHTFFVALIFTTGVVTGSACGEDAAAPTGMFSSAATFLTRAYIDHLTVIVPSPDNRSRLVIRAEKQSYALRVEGRIGSLKAPIAYGPNTEVLWSPDSLAFLVTENDGGLTGSYLLTVVGQVNGRLTVRHLSKLVATQFGHPVRCFEPESPNVVGLTWLGSSRELIAVAEIVPHSNCDSMGTFTAYSVDPWRSRVLNTYTQAEAKEHFGSLMGPRLLNAPDGCGKEPEACYIPQLHPELKPR